MPESNLNPAHEHDEAMPTRPATVVQGGTAVEHNQAIPGTVIQGTATVVAGPSAPQVASTGDAIGVLGLLSGNAAAGFGVGHAVGGLPGGAVGAFAGGAITVAGLRWKPARERTFRFIRSLTGD